MQKFLRAKVTLRLYLTPSHFSTKKVLHGGYFCSKGNFCMGVKKMNKINSKKYKKKLKESLMKKDKKKCHRSRVKVRYNSDSKKIKQIMYIFLTVQPL